MILESPVSHEYLRDTLDSKYRECGSCANRTEFTCIVCGFCWSCHWKMEHAGKFELLNIQLKSSIPIHTSYSVDQEKEKH